MSGVLILMSMLAWASYIAYRFHSTVPHPMKLPVLFNEESAEVFFPWVLLRLAALAACSAGFLETGRWIARRCGVLFHNLWEETFISFSLGYGCWGSILFLLGLGGLWRRELLAALFFLMAAGGTAVFLRRWRKNSLGVEPSDWNYSLLTWVSGGLFLTAAFYAFRYTLVPETAYDALHYHLALPNRYLLEHRIVPTPENSFSGMPLLPSMIDGLILAVDRWGILAGMLHGSFLFWIAAGFLGLSRRLERPEAGPLACLMFAMIPTVQIEAFRISVGLEWTLLQLACLNAYFASIGAGSEELSRRGWRWLFGALLGLTMTVKYPAWIVPLGFIAAEICHRIHRDQDAGQFSVSDIIKIAGVAGLILSPWIVKNIWFYGNPIYPYLQKLLAPGALCIPDPKLIAESSLSSGFSGFIEYLSHPIQSVMAKKGFTESFGPAPIALLPLIFLGTLSSRLRILAYFCAATWIPLSLISTYPRVLIPHLAALSLLLASVAVGDWSQSGRKLFAFLACALCLLTGWDYIRADTLQKGRLAVLAGRLSPGHFLEHTSVPGYPNPAYAGIDYINRNAPQDAKVLVFGDSRSFYLQRPAFASSFDQIALLATWANSFPQPEQLKNKLREFGISYILVNYGEAARQKSTLRFSTEGKAALNAFWKKYALHEFGVKESPDRWVAVYRLLSDSEALIPHTSDDLLSLCDVP